MQEKLGNDKKTIIQNVLLELDPIPNLTDWMDAYIRTRKEAKDLRERVAKMIISKAKIKEQPTIM